MKVVLRSISQSIFFLKSDTTGLKIEYEATQFPDMVRVAEGLRADAAIVSASHVKLRVIEPPKKGAKCYSRVY